MEVVKLHPDLACTDIVRALRNIADDIETGRYDFTPNMAVVVLGLDQQRRDAEGFTVSYRWQTHGLGDKASVMATRGLLASAMSSFDGGNK